MIKAIFIVLFAIIVLECSGQYSNYSPYYGYAPQGNYYYSRPMQYNNMGMNYPYGYNYYPQYGGYYNNYNYRPYAYGAQTYMPSQSMFGSTNAYLFSMDTGNGQ